MTFDELVAMSRAQQGLPPRVTDPAALRRIASQITTVDKRTTAPGEASAPERSKESRRDRHPT